MLQGCCYPLFQCAAVYDLDCSCVVCHCGKCWTLLCCVCHSECSAESSSEWSVRVCCPGYRAPLMELNTALHCCPWCWTSTYAAVYGIEQRGCHMALNTSRASVSMVPNPAFRTAVYSAESNPRRCPWCWEQPVPLSMVLITTMRGFHHYSPGVQHYSIRGTVRGAERLHPALRILLKAAGCWSVPTIRSFLVLEVL